MVFNAQGKISYIFLQTFLKPDKLFSIIPCLHNFSYFICSWLSIFLVLNFQDWLEELWSFSDVGLFFMYEKLQSDLFQISNFFYWYGLQWLLPLDFQIIHTRFYPHCCFWYYVHSLTVQIICCHFPYCYITKLSSRLIIFINALDRFLSLKETRIMVSGLLCKINSFWSCWLNSTMMIEYWTVDLEPL